MFICLVRLIILNNSFINKSKKFCWGGIHFLFSFIIEEIDILGRNDLRMERALLCYCVNS